MPKQQDLPTSAAVDAGAHAGKTHARTTFTQGVISEPQELAQQSYSDFDAWKAERLNQDNAGDAINEAADTVMQNTIEEKEVLLSGKLPNPYLVGLEVLLTPTEANKGEAEEKLYVSKVTLPTPFVKQPMRNIQTNSTCA